MGTRYIGGATYFRSIGQNLLAMKSSYGFENGYFGKNDGKSNNKVRTITTNNPEDTAREFFNRISYGGIDVSKDGVTMTQTHDGSIITFRLKTSSDGSPAVDINIEYSTHAAGIKRQKIHFAKPMEDK
jgi:hypothetical protein